MRTPHSSVLGAAASRSFIRIAAAAMAIWFSAAAVSEGAKATQFQTGDFVTFTQSDWGDRPSIFTQLNFQNVYPLGLRVGHLSPSFSLLFSSSQPVVNYLPTGGVSGPLTSSYVDPGIPAAGLFGGQIVALHLNVDFSDAGLLGAAGIPFGDLELINLDGIYTVLNGRTVREVVAEADVAISGGTAILTPAQFSPDLPGGSFSIGLLNISFHMDGIPTQWAQDHLRIAETAVPVPEPATLAIVLLGLFGLLMVRRKQTVPLVVKI